MSLLRAFFTVCLILVLVGTSGAMAIARGEMAKPAAFTVVICTWAGTELMALDADGNPVSAPHTCPDCTLNGFAHGQIAPQQAPRPIKCAGQRVIPKPYAARSGPDFPGAYARAPPILS